VVEFSFIIHETRSSMHYGLQFFKCKSEVHRVWHYHSLNWSERAPPRGPRETEADASYSPQRAKTSGGDFDNVIVYRKNRVQQNAEVANLRCRHDELVAHANRISRKLMLAPSSCKSNKVGF
jgi:hypothetical protein